MAALVTANLGQWLRTYGMNYAGPTLVADAVETDLSTPDTTLVFDAKGIDFATAKIAFANYTSVTVKWQGSNDGGLTYQDITNATTGTTATSITVAKHGVSDTTDKIGILRHPLIRLSVAGTLSGGADTMTVWVYMERRAS